MDFQKLSVTDFKLSKEKFHHSINEREPAEKGELIHAFTYTTKCKVFDRNVVLKIVFWNPKESFADSLIKIKNELKWLAANQSKILALMATQRKADDFNKRLFNSNQTRNMDDAKFMKFLTLAEVRITNGYDMTLKFNEYDDIPGTFFLFAIYSNKQYMTLSSGS